MKILSNITETNLDSYVQKLASDVKTIEPDDKSVLSSSTVDTVLNVNRYFIRTKTKKFKLAKIQLKNSKILFNNNYISELEYQDFKNYFKLLELEKKIDDYNSYFSQSINHSREVNIAIKELVKACKSGLILELNYKYLKKIDTLVSSLASHIKRSPAADQITTQCNYDKLINSLAKKIAYNHILQKQDIAIEIKPISSSFEIEEINFKSDNNKKIFNKNSLVLNNYHIKSLNINEFLYGIEGKLSFELDFPSGHPDFEFLFKSNELLLLDIKITDKFNFLKKGSKTENHQRLSRFVVIANTKGLNINEAYNVNIYSKDFKETTSSTIKSFEVNFCDPIKALWQLHKPNYIDFKKSVDDIIKDNFFFDNIVKIDSNNCENIKSQLPQVFISTVARNFYDFFIEQLQLNNCFIKYFCDKKSGEVTYYIVDKPDSSLINKIENTDEDLKSSLHVYDISSIRKQQLISQATDFYTKETYITPDITLSSRKKDVTPPTNAEAFSSIYESPLNPVFYHSQQKSEDKNIITDKYSLELSSMNNLPFIDTDLSLAKLQKNKDKSSFLGSENINNYFFTQRNIELAQCDYSSKQLSQEIHKFHYKSNSVKDVYEKIAFCKPLYLTHTNSIKYTIYNYDDLNAQYPSYKEFIPFDIIGKVTIGENVNSDSKKAYKFFKDFKSEESSFAEFQESNEKGSSTVSNSKQQLLYCIKVPQEIINPNSSNKPIIYIPAKINVNSSNNQFMPLRNDDNIIAEIQSLDSCEIIQILSNTAVSTDKTQKQLMQRQLLGAKENCEVAYSQANDDETYSIIQQNEDSENSFFINKKNGIFIKYKAKEN